MSEEEKQFFSPDEEVNALVGPMKMAAILTHELMTTFEDAGFTRDEAFQLLKIVVLPKLGM